MKSKGSVNKKFRIINVKSMVVIMIIVISIFITTASMVTVYLKFGGNINDIL